MGEEGKRKKRGSPVLMEGSRCSRVNGRGWRCFQQTLVGYSLCEHHLGKGRLRSMSSVRGSKSGASTTTKHKDIVDGESTANLAGKKGREEDWDDEGSFDQYLARRDRPRGRCNHIVLSGACAGNRQAIGVD
ncbi:uncharacterized protein M6B38_374205 [Iris pallida]|uniref:WRC domain-containing protein n=1 Tax=Iris pallida TaxID=29817 RepID=A0AAX6GBS3_IRIPA|nr:uncharacterized protein M6B38_374205 [Iris pallida]